MPMPLSELEACLREAFPDAEITIDDLAGDNDHYRARIRSVAFAGLSRVRQHQLVYAALKGKDGRRTARVGFGNDPGLIWPDSPPSS